MFRDAVLVVDYNLLDAKQCDAKAFARIDFDCFSVQRNFDLVNFKVEKCFDYGSVIGFGTHSAQVLQTGFYCVKYYIVKSEEASPQKHPPSKTEKFL